ncbi:Protein kinase, putative, partial [Hondaea fermentalgiana]
MSALFAQTTVQLVDAADLCELSLKLWNFCSSIIVAVVCIIFRILELSSDPLALLSCVTKVFNKRFCAVRVWCLEPWLEAGQKRMLDTFSRGIFHGIFRAQYLELGPKSRLYRLSPTSELGHSLWMHERHVKSAIHRNRTLYEKSQTPLMKACKEGSLAKARSAIASGCRINARDSLGMTPLVYACQASNEEKIIEMVVYLFSQSGSLSCEELGMGKALAHCSAELGIVSAQERQLFAEAFAEGEKNSKLETLAATVAFARKLRGSGKPVLHKMLRSAMTEHLVLCSTLEALMSFDTEQANIRKQAATFQQLQAMVAAMPTKAETRNACRKNLVNSVRKALAGGIQDHLDEFEKRDDMQRIVGMYRTLWKDILLVPVEYSTYDDPVKLSEVQRATKYALGKLEEWERRHDPFAACERTHDAIRALDASATNLGVQSALYMTLMHPEQMSKLKGSTEVVERAFQSELEVLCTEDPARDAPRNDIRGLQAPDTQRVESLVQHLRGPPKKRKRIDRDLEDAITKAADGDLIAQASLPELERELVEIDSVYTLDNSLPQERARVLRHAKTHYPELLCDKAWLKRVGISDGVPRELSKVNLWHSHIKRESFANLAAFTSKPGKTVEKVRASDGRTLVLRAFDLTDNTWSCCFYRQVAALAKLRSSANIVRIKSAFMQNAQDGYVVMPYYPGGDLASWIRDNAHADVATRRTIATGILRGLHDLHSRNLVHCDIKPENIFLARGLSPVLGDFDSVQTLHATMKQAAQASNKYTAPELDRKTDRHVCPAMDMFSVGMLLKELYKDCKTTPAFKKLVSALTSKRSQRRPSALKALEHEAFYVEPVPVKVCAICLDTFSIAKGVACGNAHFTCKTCLKGAIEAAAKPDGHVQILKDGSMNCIIFGCKRRISGRIIAAAVPEKDYKVLQRIVRKHTERELAREHERDVQRRVNEALRNHGRDSTMQKHVRKIQNEILTMTCPRCSAAFA